MYVTLLYPPCDKVNAAYIRQKTPKIRGFQSAKCLEDFPLPEHQNIRKAVLCVLPKEFCVQRSGKDPMIQGFHLSCSSIRRDDDEETAWKLFEDGGTSPTLLSLLLTIAMVRLYLAAKSPRV